MMAIAVDANMDHFREGCVQYKQRARNTEWQDLFMRKTTIDANMDPLREGRGRTCN
jgi:hypothetical protein